MIFETSDNQHQSLIGQCNYLAHFTSDLSLQSEIELKQNQVYGPSDPQNEINLQQNIVYGMARATVRMEGKDVNFQSS